MKKIIFPALIFLGVIPNIPFSRAFAQSQATISISPNIPGINNVSTAGPCGWIVGFYYFALLFAGILAFGSIVYGGFKYATSAGNASSQSEGRSWIWSALIGLLLLAGAYLILYTINPSLTKCSLPTLSGVNIASSGTGAGGITGGGTTGTPPPNACAAPANGPCSNANAAALSCFGNATQFMQGVCNRESGGNPAIPSGVDIGADGNPVSFGLFQINISATSLVDPTTGKTVPCPSAFSGGAYTAKNHATTVSNQALYNQCVALAKDPTANIQNACLMSKGGTYLAPWKSNSGACGI
jgi:hypothetical protein